MWESDSNTTSLVDTHDRAINQSVDVTRDTKGDAVEEEVDGLG